MNEYVPRLVDALLDDLHQDHRAILLVGPRACGKTTTGRRHSLARLQLDRPAEALAARADPDVAIAAGPFPLLIDEWQVVPEILGAVKRALDDGEADVRYLLTGSSQTDLTAAGWPGTGRVIRVPMYGLAERELDGDVTAGAWIDRIVAGEPLVPREAPDIREYVARALRGGFPEVAFFDNPRSRSRWLASYVDHIVTRDIALAGAVRDPVRLRRYLQALAGSTAGTPTLNTLIDPLGISRSQAASYDGVLQQLLITEQLPAWSTNRLNRLARLPKRYLLDAALVGPLLGLDSRAVLRDGDLLGRVLDTFVAAQLRADAVVSDLGPRLFHLRDANGRHEVDLIVELADGRVIAIEIKAQAAPDQTAAQHLRWLRTAIGDRFVAGVVLHAGPRAFTFEDGILALPISSLWC